MKKNIYVFLSCLFCLQTVFFTSCNTFESEPLNWNSEGRVLNPGDSTDNNAAKQLFHACYLTLPSLHNRLSDSYLDAATDDGLPTNASSNLNNFRNNLISATNHPDGGDAWVFGYAGIRLVNVFLSKIDLFPPSAQLPVYYINQMKAEARLLRAFYYFEMLKRWGGVPMLGDRVLSADDNLNIPRASIQEVADYITNEISPDVQGSCYNDLHAAQSIADDEDINNQGNMIGHVNRGVALGLLSRLHLYLASDLYSASNDIAKWQTAAKWAKWLINLKVYELYENKADPSCLFAMKGDSFPNKEMIMIRMMNSSKQIEVNNAPAGFSYNASGGRITSHGYTSPSQSLVDAFLTIDGKSIFKDYDPEKGYDTVAGYDEQNPYANRDPRLNSFIFTNGSSWLNKTVETFDGGINRGAEQGTSYTRTGYYLKKFLSNSEKVNVYDELYHHFQIIRYAEILLNYAEAVNECDPTNDTEIVAGLIALRKRAGINAGGDDRYGLPAPGTYNQALMRKIIRNERRIELCYEEHRFWDIRRWKIAEDVMNKPVRGVRIKKEGETFAYSYENVASSSFLPYMYWYPIPRSELYGNNAMIPNPGWSY